MMERHPDWERLEKLMPAVRAFQRLAQEHGIDDIFQDNGGIFQDNGGKILQMLLALNLQGIPGERVTTLLTRRVGSTNSRASISGYRPASLPIIISMFRSLTSIGKIR